MAQNQHLGESKKGEDETTATRKGQNQHLKRIVRKCRGDPKKCLKTIGLNLHKGDRGFNILYGGFVREIVLETP